MKQYAILDAICLVPIYDAMLQELKELNRMSWLEEECRFIAENAKNTSPVKRNPYAFRIKGSSRMSLRSLAVLREVWELRDRIAEKIDRASFMVLGNQALLEIARQKPRSISGLSVIKSVSRDFLSRHGSELQSAIKRGIQAPLVDLEPPSKPRRNSLSAWEGELAKALREKRNDLANKLGLAASLLAPSHAIYDLARLRPKTSGQLSQCEILHGWQAKLLAPEFIPLLQQEPDLTQRKKRRRRRKKS
jgi:ribonuclease D